MIILKSQAHQEHAFKKQKQKSLQMFVLVMQQRKRNSGKSSEAEELQRYLITLKRYRVSLRNLKKQN